MTVTKVGRRGQIILPRDVREWLHLQEGDQLAFVKLGEQVTVRTVTKNLLDLRGSIPASRPQDFTSIRRRVLKDHVRKVVN